MSSCSLWSSTKETGKGRKLTWIEWVILFPLLMKRIPLSDLCCHLWRMYLVTLWNSIQSFIHMCLSQKSLWSILQLCFFWIPDNLVIPLVTDHQSAQIFTSGSLLKSKVNSKINRVSVYWENFLPQQSFEATPKGGNGGSAAYFCYVQTCAEPIAIINQLF